MKDYERFNKCNNCLHYIKDSPKMGYCKKLKAVSGYKFKHNDEDFNSESAYPALYPRVHRYATCDNYIHKSNKNIEYL